MSEQDSTCALPELPNATGVNFRYLPGNNAYCVGDDGSVWTRRVRHRVEKGVFKWVPSDSWTKLKNTCAPSWYATVAIWGDGVSATKCVHSLVLEAFVGPRPTGMLACHGNGNRHDARLSNLRWDTPSSNMADMVRHGNSQRGERARHGKLTVREVRAIRRIVSEGILSIRKTSEVFDVRPATISAIVNRKTWRHINP